MWVEARKKFWCKKCQNDLGMLLIWMETRGGRGMFVNKVDTA